MKIAALVGQFPSLSETFILNQITGIIDRGHDVTVIAPRPGDDPKVHGDVNRYRLVERTFYYGRLAPNIPSNSFLRLLKGLSLLFRHLHRNPGAVLKALNIFKFGREAASLSIFFRIIPFLEMPYYDLVHCHFGPNGNLGALLKEVGIIRGPLVTTFYGFDATRYVLQNGEDVYQRLFREGSMILSLSEVMKNELIRLGCLKGKVAVHHLGVATERFSFCQRMKRQDGTVRVLTLARLVEKKGLEYGIRAVAKLLPCYPLLSYTIVGDGELRNDLDYLITSLGVQGNIQLAGWKSQDEVIEFLREADIFLAPSVTASDGDQEGTPTVLMEALALGLPVVSTYHSGIPEVVEEGKSGFLVQERDADALAEKLKYLIEHQELWPEMGQAGRKYIETNYDIHTLNDRLVEIYRGMTT